MKITFIFTFFFSCVSVLAHAQVDEKAFLNEAKTWVDTNLQCEINVDENLMPVTAHLGKCEIAGNVFCHLYSPNSTELILQVSGKGSMVAGGITTGEDNKLIIFTLVNDKLLADVFYETSNEHTSDSWMMPELIRFPNGPDLISTKDGGSYCGSSSAHLFGMVSGKIKKILDYQYLDQCHQREDGYETFLSPLKNRDLRLMKFKQTTQPSDGYGGELEIAFSEVLYHYDSSQEVYVPTQEEKAIPLGKGVLDWWDAKLDNGANGIHWGGGFNENISANSEALEEIISNLKNKNNEARSKHAYWLLKGIAGIDLGYNYDAWEKWNNDLNKTIIVPFVNDRFVAKLEKVFKDEGFKLVPMDETDQISSYDSANDRYTKPNNWKGPKYSLLVEGIQKTDGYYANPCKVTLMVNATGNHLSCLTKRDDDLALGEFKKKIDSFLNSGGI